MADFKKVAQLTLAELTQLLADFCAEFGFPTLGIDENILTQAQDSPLSGNWNIFGANRQIPFWIHAMEGWDGTANADIHGNGHPSHLTFRRWMRFGKSRAHLWGGEAMAVREDGRANHRQLIAKPETMIGLEALALAARNSHAANYGVESAANMLIGAQVTHSGRYCIPNAFGQKEPRVMHRHPVLDSRWNVTDDAQIFTDSELDDLIEYYVAAGIALLTVGFDFIDIKHCHGYLLHEMLAAKTRPGNYGGSFENRTRFLREVVKGIRAKVPDAKFGVRLSIADELPIGQFDAYDYEALHFGLTKDGKPDITEAILFANLCKELGIGALNATFGSPYYNPFAQRPAAFPPFDGKPVDVDPLKYVVQQLGLTRALKEAVPGLPIIGTGYTYLQQYLPHVAQWVIRNGWVDAVGMGRMVLSYPHFLHDVLSNGTLDRRLICRTFSDCTNGPRIGKVSGCYPLDPGYKAMDAWDAIKAKKAEAKPS